MSIAKPPRYQGRITSWKDDQGFGFITPNGGGPAVFVHIKSFARPGRRPAGDQIVTYYLTMNEQGQPRADSVAFVGDRAAPRASRPTGASALACGIVFLAVVAGFIFTGKLPPLVLALYLAMSAAAYVAYALDKSAAQNDRWRTPESTLHLLGLAGGWPGALLAQKILRHKSKKRSFLTTFWFTVVVHCGAFGWFMWSPSGATALRTILEAA